jgi:hypothetical protein
LQNIQGQSSLTEAAYKHSYKTRPGVDPVKGPGPGVYGSTRVDPGQPEKIKKIKILIFHMKKLKKINVNICYTCCK